MRNSIFLLLAGMQFACQSNPSASTTSSGESRYESPAPKQKYDVATARFLGKLYYLSNPYQVASNPMGITNLVRDNAHLLGDNSRVIQCARDLGNLMVNQGLRSFGNQDNDRERMYDIGHENGVDPLVTKRAADEMYNGAVDVFMIGQELNWLARVIPEAANGNWDPFNTTGTQTRQQFYQVWPIYQSIMNSDYTDPYTKQVMEQMMTQLQPIVEHQVTLLALMIQNQ